jgi:hypothetical protein
LIEERPDGLERKLNLPRADVEALHPDTLAGISHSGWIVESPHFYH